MQDLFAISSEERRNDLRFKGGVKKAILCFILCKSKFSPCLTGAAG